MKINWRVRMKTNLKYDSKQLKKELKQAVSEQCEILCEENQKCYDALRYVRPRTKLESMHAELCLTNKNYANILGLGKLMKNHQELTDDDWNEFINKHKVNLRFLNNLLKVVPDFIATIRTYGEDKVVFEYVRALENNRVNRKSQ